MGEHDPDADRSSPRWVPYTPPPLEGWERVGEILRWLAFPVLVALFAVGVGALFLFWQSQHTARPGGAVGSQPLPVETAPNKPERPALLSVRTNPDGARIQLNGDSIGMAPLTERSVSPGVYMLTVRADGYHRADTVLVLSEGSAPNVRMVLRPRLNYQAARPSEGASPAEPNADTAPTGRSLPITSVPSPTTPPEPEQTPTTGALYVTSSPTGGIVTVNGQERGRTPLSVNDVPAGVQPVSVALDGYERWSLQSRVRAGEMVRLHADLRRQTGRLRVLARPWGTIYIDGALRARETDVWYEAELPAGQHQVTVVHPALGEQRRTVVVPAGRDTSLVIDLQG